MTILLYKYWLHQMKGVDANLLSRLHLCLAPFYHYEWGVPLSQQCTSAGVCLKMLAISIFYYEWEICLSSAIRSCFGANLPSPVWLPFIIMSRGFLCLSNALQQEFVRKFAYFLCGANLPFPVWLPFIIRSGGFLCLSDALQQEFVWKCLHYFLRFGANLPSLVWLPFIIRSGGFLCLSNALQQEFVYPNRWETLA